MSRQLNIFDNPLPRKDVAHQLPKMSKWEHGMMYRQYHKEFREIFMLNLDVYYDLCGFGIVKFNDTLCCNGELISHIRDEYGEKAVALINNLNNFPSLYEIINVGMENG